MNTKGTRIATSKGLLPELDVSREQTLIKMPEKTTDANNIPPRQEDDGSASMGAVAYHQMGGFSMSENSGTKDQPGK